MVSNFPNVNDNKLVDPAIRLYLCTPNTVSHQSYYARLADAFDIQASWQRRSPGALSFKTFKDSPNVDLLSAKQGPNGGSEEYSIAVQIYDPRRDKWMEMPDSRFVVSKVQEDLVDGTNIVSYSCVQEVEMLKRVLLDRVPGDWKLNNAYDKAKKAYDDAEGEYDRLMKQFTEKGRMVQNSRFGHTRGNLYAGYRGTDWVTKSWGEQPWGTLFVCHLRKQIMMYQPSTKRWLRLPNNHQNRQDMIDLGNQIRTARRTMESRRAAYAKAERAQRETARGGSRFFYRRTPARVLQRAWTEGARRDAGRNWTPSFNTTRVKGFWRDWSNTRDGKNRLWTRNTSTSNWEFPLGISFFDMVQDFCERGELDWQCRGRTFSIVPYGDLEVDQSSRVVIRGDDAREAPEEIDRMDHYSYTLTKAGNGYAYWSEWGPNVWTSATPWGWWEGSISDSDVDSQAKADTLTRARRAEKHFRETVDSMRRVSLTPNMAIPVVDYMPHHWISVYDHQGSLSKRVVDQIILSQDDDGILEATITLGTRRERRMTTYGRTIQKTINGTDYIQGHIPIDSRLELPTAPTEALYTPPITDLTATVRIREDGQPVTVLRAQWADVGLPEPASAGEGESISDDPVDDGSVGA